MKALVYSSEVEAGSIETLAIDYSLEVFISLDDYAEKLLDAEEALP